MNRINVYACQDGHWTITVQRVPGTTSYMICCRHPDCRLMAESSFGMVAQDQAPTHEWYKPEPSQIHDDATREHVRKGGLLLRPVPRSES